MRKLVIALFVFAVTLGFYACSVEEVGPNGLDTTQGMGFEEGPIDDDIDASDGVDPNDNGFPIDDPIDPMGGGPGGDPTPPPTCADYQEASIYWNADTYLSGVESGHDVVFLEVTGGWPIGTTYAWLLKYEDGTTNYYPHSAEVPRMVDASFDNKITEVSITARYEDCEGTGTIVANPPFPQEGGYGKVGGHFLDKVKFRSVY